MKKSRSIGNKGQAAALDLAIFLGVCILALSYLVVQSARSSASTMFIEENENVHEIAIRSLDSLAHSSGGELEIKTIQPIALASVEMGLSEDVRTIFSYADKCIDILDQLEKDVRNDGYLSLDSPYFTYIEGKIDDISSYLLKAKDLVGETVKGWLEEAEANMGAPCEAIGYLASLLPGYEDVEGGCLTGIGSQFLDDLMDSLLDAEQIVSDFKGMIEQELNKFVDMMGDELEEGIRALRCTLIEIKDISNSLLTYLETGLNMEVSFLELWPVEARVEGMTLQKMLGDSMVVGSNFAMGDDLRSVAGAAGLLILRDDDIVGENFTIDDDIEELEGAKNQTEDVIMVAKDLLDQITNVSAEGHYHELMFGVETYLTSANALAVRLKVWGNAIGGVKQKTEYFEDMDYVLNSTTYPTQTHHRTYNTSSMQAVVIEDRVTITTRNWTVAENLSDEIKALSEFKETRILRPMTARVNFTYDNKTWAQEIYSFDIEHYRISSESNYYVNTSQKDVDGNVSDAFKSIILGIIFSDRTDLKTRVAEAIEERLDELLKSYDYKFEVKDCCRTFLEINADLEPEGRAGIAKYYFMGDNARAEMKLTVWRPEE